MLLSISTPYQYASNRPIDGIDLDGLEWSHAYNPSFTYGRSLVKKTGDEEALKRYDDAMMRANNLQLGITLGAGAVVADVYFTKGRITKSATKDIMAQIIANSIRNGFNFEEAVNDVDLANAAVKGVLSGTGLDKTPLGKYSGELLKTSFSLRVRDGKFTQDLTDDKGNISADAVEEFFFRAIFTNIKLGKFSTDQQKFAEDILKKTIRGALQELNLLQNETSTPISIDRFDIDGQFLVPQDNTNLDLNLNRIMISEGEKKEKTEEK